MGISSALGSSALLPAGLGFRNVLINGGMDVWQRGTSNYNITPASPYYTVDRWQTTRASAAADGTLSRQTASLDGFQYCVRLGRNSGTSGTNAFYMAQSIETTNVYRMQGKPVVLSFYARAGANYSAASSAFVADIIGGTGTDSNILNTGFTSQSTLATNTVTLTTSWQRFFVYYTPNLGSTITQLGVRFTFTPVGTAGAADYFEITGVQLESNVQPTPFEQRPIGVELALCQRYCVRWGGQSTYGYDNAGTGWAASTTGAGIVVKFSTPMRVMPTSISSSGIRLTDFVSTYSVSAIGINAFISNCLSAQLDCTTSGMVAYRPCDLQVGGGSLSNYLILSAEL